MIHHSEHLDFTPAMVLALEGQIELIRQRGYEAQNLVANSLNVIWIDDENGDAASCIVYDATDHGSQKHIWIWLSYTRPDQRRKGLHKLLFAELERRSSEAGIDVIEGGVMADNVAMAAAAVSCGRVLRHVVWQKKLAPKSSATATVTP